MRASCKRKKTIRKRLSRMRMPTIAMRSARRRRLRKRPRPLLHWQMPVKAKRRPSMAVKRTTMRCLKSALLPTSLRLLLSSVSRTSSATLSFLRRLRLK